MASSSRGTFVVVLLWALLMQFAAQYNATIISGHKNQEHVKVIAEVPASSPIAKREIQRKRVVTPPRPSGRDLEASVAFARGVVTKMGRLEANLNGANVNVRQGTPAHGQLIDSYPCAQALHHGKEALIAVKASVFLQHNHCRRFGLDEEHCAKLISKLQMNATSLGKTCQYPTGTSSYCTNAKYRTYDGSCNRQNLANEGQALTGYRRLLPADYGDGIQQPRENAKGKLLPSARLISTHLAREGNKLEEDKTLALMQWSQFVEHDMSHTPVSKMSNADSSIICCKPDGGMLLPRYLHPSCLPVTIPANDPFYSHQRIQCMNYVRSVPAMRKDCTFGPMEQLNQASHFLDGTMIYGTTNQKASSLRQYVQGKLKDSNKDGRAFLPSADQPTNECQVNNDATTCYKSGDVRVNAHPHLTVMYTLWHREHNRVAGELALLNPRWDDETLYQEARRIVVAEIQHITYNEWLPVVLGEKYMKKLGITLKKTSYSNNFDSSVDPSVSNSFSTAALRFVHSMMESRLRLYDEDRSAATNSTILLRHHFNRPRIVEEEGHLDAFTRGLATQNSQKTDMDYIKDITSLLYQDSNPYGLDIISLDVQRGRDHGLPGYNKFRKICGLPEATSFDQFHDVIPRQIIAKLRAIYNHPNDVDLLIGGMSEQPSGDGMLGATFRCIIGEQFTRTMKGDRYFYDLQNQPHSFTSEQLKAVKKVTLARIFCDNSDDIVSMQPNVFRKPSTSNKLVKCHGSSRIPSLDLNQWKENEILS